MSHKKLDTITREEFDRRLEQATDRMRSRRLTLENRSAELEDLIGRYSSVLERLEAESKLEADVFSVKREELRNILTALA